MNILVAEDDLSSRMILVGILKKWDYDPIAVEDGEKAWQVIEQGDAPNLILLDWDMPGMDGLTLCHKLRSLNLTPPAYIILLTGRDAKEDIVQGLNAGADDYITKPFDKNELKSRLNVAKRLISVQNALATKINELQDALDHVKLLQGIIPICMYCHKIRNVSDAWDQLEVYISNHSDAEFSHSICPQCLAERYPDMDFDDEG